MKERISYIDFGAGIMILWMIIYHAIGTKWGVELRDILGTQAIPGMNLPDTTCVDANGIIRKINPCVVFPYLNFFMPWFFFKSGMFFKKMNWRTLWNKDKLKLLKKYVIWSTVGYVIFIMFRLFSGSLTLHEATYTILRGFLLTGRIPINAVLWFLLSLFVVRFVSNGILPSLNSKFYHIRCVFIVVIGGLVAYFAYRFNNRLMPYWIANCASGLAFFALGYWLKDFQFKNWLFFPSLLVYVTCCIFGFPYVIMMSNTLVQSSYLLWIPASLCGIVVFNNMCRIVCDVVCKFAPSHIRVRPLELVGRFSMPIYVTHALIYESVAQIVLIFDKESIEHCVLWLTLVAYVMFLPIICWGAKQVRQHKIKIDAI